MWRPDLLSHFPLSLRSLFSGFEFRFTPSGLEKIAGAEIKIEFLVNGKVKETSIIKLSGQKQEHICELSEGLDFYVTDSLIKSFRSVKSFYVGKRRLLLKVLESTRYMRGRFEAGIKNFISRVLIPDDTRSYTRKSLLLDDNELEERRLTIILPVYNALDAVDQCLRSIQSQLNADQCLLIVDDSSDNQTREYLQNFVSNNSHASLHRCDKNQGFVKACNKGLELADPNSDILLLNSDTVLPPDAITRLKLAAYSRKEVGAASPLSTASPNLQVAIPSGENIFDVDAFIRDHHIPSYPTVVTPEGQCLYLRRWAIDRYGFFDPIFGRGFGEESDLLMRWLEMGVDTVCVDNLLIFHRKSASFGEEEANLLKAKNKDVFFSRWDKKYRAAFRRYMEPSPVEIVRTTVKKSEASKIPMATFLLSSTSLGGGNISVFQHVNELNLAGECVDILVIGEEAPIEYHLLTTPKFMSEKEFLSHDWGPRTFIATFWRTAEILEKALAASPETRGFYYVQGYEPWFYLSSHLNERKTVEETYAGKLPMLVKTAFLKEIILERHGQRAEQIPPGIDTTVFYPPDKPQRPFSVVVPYRPGQRWRGAQEALLFIQEVLQSNDSIDVIVYGDTQLFPLEHDRIRLVDSPLPSQVANLYRESAVVVDFCSIHGFGRPGIEGMACGAIPIVVDSGGAQSYLRDGENGFLFTWHNWKEAVSICSDLAFNEEKRSALRAAGIQTARSLSERESSTAFFKFLQKGVYCSAINI